MTPKLHLQNLSKSFGAKQVLNGLDLAVAPGQSVVVIGASGVGKSVMLKCALGLMRPDAGRILLDGADITDLTGAKRAEALRAFGMLFQGSALFDSLPVWENVAFRLINADGLSRAAAKDRAMEALAKVRLAPEVGALLPTALSGGMQKRAALARAIVARPQILFFDEPTTGLDPITADAINALILEMVRELGCAAVSITHDMASARTIADEIAMLHQGVLVWRGPAAQVMDSGNPFVDQFVHGRSEGPISSLGPSSSLGPPQG